MTTSLLEVSDISLSFGGLRALSDVSLKVDEGSIVGLIGPNGAGKTTMFNVISGLQRADAGTVSFDGADITALPARRRSALGMGRSFQHLGLIDDETVGVNVRAAQYLSADYRSWEVFLRPRKWRQNERRIEQKAREAVAAIGLTEDWGTRVSDLSFGRARFVEMACLLVERPRLMLLDEPTTGLDVNEVAQLLGTLQAERAAGATVLLVAHDVRFVMDLCDYVYVLAEGQLLFDGPPAEVQKHPRVIEAYLGRSA